MTPDRFAAAELAVKIDRSGKVDRLPKAICFGSGETFSKGLQRVFEVALRGDRVNDGDHQAIISPRPGIVHNAGLLQQVRSR
ncbi:hypothetical protein ACCAA_810052 [Candidatus Accumulibacter aalborgensis]|uniref:Uncharacterized protein n=1 Tax=Candidatus Accumulibacter aalborgensis TaxID=1860102 RepID=A0A1A8Y0Z8_9PROT|nr:hypothetical protein ACCAA_810052 [Candidatus Accumulibacter aalborgensis]